MHCRPCLWDRQAKIGGMNHFMLPDNGGGASDSGWLRFLRDGTADQRNAEDGASRLTLEAKVFGGGAVISGHDTINVGERNTAFVMEYLKTERIPVVSKDVLEIYPRKVCFFPIAAKPWSSAWPEPTRNRSSSRNAWPPRRWSRFRLAVVRLICSDKGDTPWPRFA